MEEAFLSRLPEELIHRILGFLTTQDAIKVSLLSKSLQASWLSSSPSLHFHEKDFLFENPGEPLQRNLKRFHEYVFNTMVRVSTRRITSFRFQTSYLNDSETLDKWIGIALDGYVGEIYLSVRGVPHCLPERLFVSSSFLKSLSLDVWGKNKLSLSAAAVDINLPCLQSLTLIRVSIDEEAFQRLLKGCPSLEYLKITPTELLSQVNISHLKLKSFNLETGCINGKALEFEVEAPCLEEFHFSDTSRDQTNVIVKCTSNIKCLSLSLSSRSWNEWLSELLPKCTSLETLRIEFWYHVETIFKISSPYVKNIMINYISLAEIEIDCPMLFSLRWTACDNTIARGGRSLPSLSVINSQPNFAGHLHMPCWSHTDLNPAWFHKLREFLSTSRMAAVSLLCSHSEEKTKNGDYKSLPTSAVKIEQLYLMVISGLPKSCYTFIMNGFLSACHPDTVLLAPPLPEEGKEPRRKEPVHFIEFFREKLENWKDADGCYCSKKIKCWKHQLKRVEIEEFNKVEDKESHCYDFGISKTNLPIPPVPAPSFRLKFQWY